MAAIELWDFDAWRELTVREVQLVREAGALTVLATALSVSIFVRIFAGELAGAGSLLDEQRIVTEASGGQLAPHAALILTAWQGREAELTALIETTVSEVEARGEGIGLSATQWVNALLHNALGKHEIALACAQQLMDPPRPYDQAIGWALPELIEAAVRTGQASVARDGLAQLAEMTRAGGTDWGLGIEARSRALLSEPSLARVVLSARRSSGLDVPLYAGSTRGRICSMANGCAGRAGARTPAINCGRRTACSPRWEWRRSPSARGANCWPPAARSAGSKT